MTRHQTKYIQYMLALDPADRARAKTDAAIYAGYSQKTARVQGARLFRNQKVVAALGGDLLAGQRSDLTRNSRKSASVSARQELGPASFTSAPAVELNDRQQRFCMEYLVDGNATQAYLRAYPNSGYESARRSACDLLTNPDILARIEELQEERNRRLGITADRVLSALARQAFYDPRDLFDADWRLKPFDELPPDAAFVVAGFTTKATVTGEDKDGICVTTNVRLPDKIRAAELLGRHLKLFTDKVEVAEDAEFVRRLGSAVEEMKRHGNGK